LSSGFNLPTKEFFVLKQIGNELNAWMIKPKDFDASKKYPVFMFQYSSRFTAGYECMGKF
jgi:dipeptidyl-peptidase-4